MKKSTTNRIALTGKIAAEVVAASAIMVGSGAFAFATPIAPVHPEQQVLADRDHDRGHDRDRDYSYHCNAYYYWESCYYYS